MSIADELALLANTKEGLRLSLGLSKDVPFRQYASHIPFYAKAGTVFDFVNNQYSKDQLPVDLSDISEFIRLSSATMWQDGELVEVGDNIPRISGEGLLVEEQRTNHARNSTDFSWVVRPNINDVTYARDPSIPAPDGTFTATLVTKTGPNARLATSSWQVGHSRSIYARTVSGSGTIYLLVMSGGGGSRLFELNEDWRRCEIPSVSHSQLHLVDFRGRSTLEEVLIWGFQSEEGSPSTSYIPTEGAQVTRGADTLNIPLLPSQTITGDWDAGVTYEVADNIATFTGYGYIRNIIVGAL